MQIRTTVHDERDDAIEAERLLRDELSHIADALGVAPYGGCYEQAEAGEMREWAHDKEIDEHERLEAQLVAVNGALSGAIRRHDALSAEHARVCNEHALLVQESGREGRELDRLEGLLRAWGESGPGWSMNRDAVYAEAVRLAGSKV